MTQQVIPAIRKYPYPYRAMLSICSDLDETPDLDTYLETVRFLNTTRQTSMGIGVGLEVGNTIYFDMPSNQFSYWNTDEAGRDKIRALIRSGHVDCLHSFGDLATTRTHAQRALEDLERNDCRLGVWIDHAVAPTNLGADIMMGQGDVESSSAYHADLTWRHGIRYVWRGRVTSLTGQGVRKVYRDIFRVRHPVTSGLTLAKEIAKSLYARLGSEKYAMHRNNDLLRPTTLRSRHPVWEFLRANPSWAGVSRNETAAGLPEVLDSKFLESLVTRGGTCLLYTHLGKLKNPHAIFESATRKSLDLLSSYCQTGKILVTTTRRLLDYTLTSNALTVNSFREGPTMTIDLSGPDFRKGHEPGSVDGLTFYVDDPARIAIRYNGEEISRLQHNPPDHSGRSSVSIVWPRLAFPCL